VEQELAQARFERDNLEKIGTLSEAERFAVVAYTSDFYKQINNPLRGREGDMLVGADPDILKWFKVLQSALNKLPAYQGITFRGDGLGSHTNLRQQGEEVADFGFSSTATQAGSALHFARSGVLAVNRVKSGRSIAALSHYGKGEAEVLMRPLTTLVTKARLEKPEGKTWKDVLRLPQHAGLLDGLDDATKDLIYQSKVKVLTFQEEV
jgi:hypothetical protein